MRIVVDRLPECPRDCLFSRSVNINGERIYICTLYSYIEDADRNDNGYKPQCVCKDVIKCDKLALEVL